jgi:hypothetical protein
LVDLLVWAGPLEFLQRGQSLAGRLEFGERIEALRLGAAATGHSEPSP